MEQQIYLGLPGIYHSCWDARFPVGKSSKQNVYNIILFTSILKNFLNLIKLLANKTDTFSRNRRNLHFRTNLAILKTNPTSVLLHQIKISWYEVKNIKKWQFLYLINLTWKKKLMPVSFVTTNLANLYQPGA